MNEHVMRCYYLSTKLESQTVGYRSYMWRLFVQKYPDLADKVTEQRVADQKRVILTTKNITHVRLEQLKAEVATEIKTDSDRTFNQEDLRPESPKNDTPMHKLSADMGISSISDSCITPVETAKS
ncbi:unnamed protein product [Parnassius apollo]|uniref:(apollo) hypothetical protein n=1 Tax=Parnassius apollo TaxID=110799 RepID=A0A8S3WU88_PARAO|nr:unnamed protein product [Parnassius apollo]